MPKQTIKIAFFKKGEADPHLSLSLPALMGHWPWLRIWSTTASGTKLSSPKVCTAHWRPEVVVLCFRFADNRGDSFLLTSVKVTVTYNPPPPPARDWRRTVSSTTQYGTGRRFGSSYRRCLGIVLGPSTKTDPARKADPALPFSTLEISSPVFFHPAGSPTRPS
ncbi:hypothetical protein J6590_081058 [Homalodisca vitripennis]|nr:hypothetical protein J6590_100580 [Homalodisca vitripennis]KAG8319918.1 hypothetical protein J6590_081058 [Homalodisca vitripennis]